MLESATLRDWCEEIDDVVLQCEAALDPHPDEEKNIVRQLCRLLREAPECVAGVFVSFDDDQLGPYFALDACEKVFLLMCERIGVMLSRSSSGWAHATIGIGALGIERSFSKENSLPLALAGAISLAALDVLEKSTGLPPRLN